MMDDARKTALSKSWKYHRQELAFPPLGILTLVVLDYELMRPSFQTFI